ncbi:MAG TPA: YkgJ family cysteine cluster protein [Usitatibacteraceae bacterium]|jgi:Fe-S-cluster containining protein|nr:YkgJ family cysteine cluster protein [Usitatibacteraceae bacterium]
MTATRKKKKPFPVKVRVQYDCLKCPAYCCTYPEIPVKKRDLERLAKHFGVDVEIAQELYTKPTEDGKGRQLRHRKDDIFKTACAFLSKENRRCTVYEARPSICREFPGEKRCGYYDFLKFEREHQEDPEFIALT